jgi:Protein of unknown function (DUF3800)
MTIYCDESGGIGRGVMTLAAILIDEDIADDILFRYRGLTGLTGELKGSRIDMPERAIFFGLLETSKAKVEVGIAISALKPEPGEDRGRHDIEIYAQLMNDTVGKLLPGGGACTSVVMDTGRYGDQILAEIRSDIAALIGPWNGAHMAESHRLAGLQIADVIANTFFNRALVTERQSQMAALVQPLLDSGQITLKLLV